MNDLFHAGYNRKIVSTYDTMELVSPPISRCEIHLFALSARGSINLGEAGFLSPTETG